MFTRSARGPVVALVNLALLWGLVAEAGSLSPDIEKQLASSKYVYISSQRKDGSFSKPAEIWFLHHKGAVWVASPPSTWRVKRINAGRRGARVSVGTVDGPSFEAVGEIVKDAEVNQLMFDTYAKKYADGWPKYETKFRHGLADGSRVLIRYQPK